MRKFTMLIASLFITIGAMAQIDVTKTYRIKHVESGKYLTAFNHDTHSTGTEGGVGVGELNTESADQIYSFEPSQNGYILRSNADYYIVGHSWNVDAIRAGGTEIGFESVGEGQYRLKKGSTHFKIENNYAYCDCNGSNGTPATWELEEVGTAKVYASSFETINPNKCYVITTKHRGGLTVDADGTTFKSTNDDGRGTYATLDNVQNHFAVVSADSENYYLYSVSAKKFVKADKTLVDGIGDALAAKDASAEGASRLRLYFKDITNSNINIGGDNEAQVNWWSNVDHGNAMLFIEVGDFNPEEALAVLSNVAEVTYNFQLNGVTIATQTETVAKGAAYPELKMPKGRLGVVIVGAKPDDTVTADVTENIELAVDNTLIPFEYVESGTPTVWYYTQIHSNKRSFIDNNLAWNADALTTSFTGEEADAYSWGFVGNVLNGFKMVNKKGLAINSTGGNDNPVTMVELDNATAFLAMPTREDVANGFCMMNSESNSYMNAHDGYVKHWTDNDAGSTIMLTEREDFKITVSDLGYATLYLDYNAYVPAGVNVYYIDGIKNGYANMTKVEGEAIPANQGFILENEGEYTFVKAIVAATDVVAIETNLLKGSVEETTIGENCYILANHDVYGLGFYGVKEGVSGAYKAYLEVPAADASAAFYGFLFEGTTGVENVVVENGAQVIFDLTGRRIESINAAGIYIVNGRKVLVK